MAEIKLISNERKISLDLGDRTILIAPCVWKHLDDLSSAQEVILQNVLANKGAMGEILRPSNTEFWSMVDLILTLIRSSLPIKAEDIEDEGILLQLFITSSSNFNEYGWLDGSLEPSFISIIHGLDFFSIMRKLLKVE